MEIVNNKVLVINTRTPEKYKCIERAHYVGTLPNGLHQVAVYWGLDEARVLRNIGVKNAPSPILRNYGWPARFAPFAHQKEIASFLTLHRKAFVFSEAGTAKTISALWAADYLMSLGRIRRVLIICPLSIMRAAWVEDAGKSIIHRTIAVAHHASADKRAEILSNKEYEFVVLNHDGITIVKDAIKKCGDFDLIIVDECNSMKNPSTRRWKALHSILEPHTHLWMMTGTPAAQSPLDAYGLAKLVCPDRVPKYRGAWQDHVMTKVSTFKWVPKRNAKELVFKALQPAIRFTKEQCLDLPPVVTTTRDVELTPQQIKYYETVRTRMLAEASGEVITAVNAAACVNKLLQISAGAVYTDTKEVVEFDCSSRLKVMLEVVEETDRKVIVFAPYRHSAEAIRTHLEGNGYVVDEINGDVTESKRAARFRRFQDKDDPLRVLIIQPQAASHGVTLTAADTIIFWGPVSSAETYIQCVARADRVGQDSSKVTVVHLQGSAIERKTYKALTEKVDFHEAIVKLYEEEVLGIQNQQ